MAHLNGLALRRRANVPLLSGWLAALMLAVVMAVSSMSAQAAALDAQARKVTIALSSEPPDLNTTTSTDSISFMVMSHTMEGLMAYDRDNNLVGGAAEHWELREDGARFRLRPGLRWSDGRPLTAHDFVFAWRQVLTPATASEYAFILYPLLNAEAVNAGELPPERLGVTALDDLTLEVRFARPLPLFSQLDRLCHALSHQRGILSQSRPALCRR